MRIIVLGADGYLGWPTALHLSAQGHEIIAADNLIRRRWDVLCGTESLIPIASMKRRVERWKAVSGRDIKWEKLDLTSLPDTICDLTVPSPLRALSADSNEAAGTRIRIEPDRSLEDDDWTKPPN